VFLSYDLHSGWDGYIFQFYLGVFLVIIFLLRAQSPLSLREDKTTSIIATIPTSGLHFFGSFVAREGFHWLHNPLPQFVHSGALNA
jgi:hypothetical protein